jgi:hypothetical protein
MVVTLTISLLSRTHLHARGGTVWPKLTTAANATSEPVVSWTLSPIPAASTDPADAVPCRTRRGFGMRVTYERRIHRIVDTINLSGVEARHPRRNPARTPVGPAFASIVSRDPSDG